VVDLSRLTEPLATSEVATNAQIELESLKELLLGDLDHLSAVADHPSQIEPLTGEHGQLAQELVPAEDGDHPVLLTVALDDRH
jgi:hypothetical protein